MAPSLEGSYDLQIIQYYDSSSNRWATSEWMKGGSGVLTYLPTDTMSVYFTTADSSEVYWYRATYSYDNKTRKVTHQRFEHSDEEQNFKTVVRRLNLERDSLTMFADDYGLRLLWIKQK